MEVLPIWIHLFLIFSVDECFIFYIFLKITITDFQKSFAFQYHKGTFEKKKSAYFLAVGHFIMSIKCIKNFVEKS